MNIRLVHILSRFWLLSCLFTQQSIAASSILIWPLNPTIEAGTQSVALWMQNENDQAITLQIRVFAWDQDGHQDVYEAQRELSGTPPFTTIPARGKQMVRLTHTAAAVVGTERAFRLIIDEIPRAVPDNESRKASTPTVGLNVQMRYSLPVFVRGAGASDSTLDAGNELAWRVEQSDGASYLRVRNDGHRTARLTQVKFRRGDGSILDVAPGLLGYVLAGREMRWPLPEPIVSADGLALETQLENNESPIKLPPF